MIGCCAQNSLHIAFPMLPMNFNFSSAARSGPIARRRSLVLPFCLFLSLSRATLAAAFFWRCFCTLVASEIAPMPKAICGYSFILCQALRRTSRRSIPSPPRRRVRRRRPPASSRVPSASAAASPVVVIIVAASPCRRTWRRARPRTGRRPGHPPTRAVRPSRGCTRQRARP